MQRTKKIVLTPANSDDDGISASQTPAAGGVQSLTIAGALASGGIATLDIPRRVAITSAGADSGKTFIVTGTADGERVISESLAGPGTGLTVYTNKDFKTVTGVTISANAAGAIKVGTNGVLSSPWIPIGREVDKVSFDTAITGTVNYSIQHTMDDPFQMAPVNGVADTYLTPFSHETSKGLTANDNGCYHKPVAAVRVLINSYTNGASITAFVRPGA